MMLLGKKCRLVFVICNFTLLNLLAVDFVEHVFVEPNVRVKPSWKLKRKNKYSTQEIPQ